jgi:hypothetical protein
MTLPETPTAPAQKYGKANRTFERIDIYMERETTFEKVKRMAGQHRPVSFAQSIRDELDPLPDFYDYINKLCVKKNKNRMDVITDAHIERNYGRQIFFGERSPSRDMVIKLAFGFGLDLDEAQYLLKIAGHKLFDGRDERDYTIMYALVHNYGIISVDKTLYELNKPTLMNKKYGK